MPNYLHAMIANGRPLFILQHSLPTYIMFLFDSKVSKLFDVFS